MSTLWIGNFSFEEQLQGRYDQPQSIQRLEAELAPCLAAAAQPEDFVLCPLPVPASYSEFLNHLGHAPPTFIVPDEVSRHSRRIQRISPWGWSEPVKRFASKCRLSFESPDIDVVRRINSRTYSHQLSCQLECALPGEFCTNSQSELRTAIDSAEFKNGFVIKQNLSQSGRGQRARSTQHLSNEDLKWINRQVAQDQTFFLEPLLSPIMELAIQWDVPREGPPEIFAVTGLQSEPNGRYQSSTVNLNFDSTPGFERIIDVQRLALNEIQKAGYFGPVGIDAMVYRDTNNRPQVRPLQDINARWTMGRLAVHWTTICFRDRRIATWGHGACPDMPRAISTSPQIVGDVPVKHQTWCS